MPSTEDKILNDIEKYDHKRGSWMLFSMRLKAAFEAKGRGKHLSSDHDPADLPLLDEKEDVAKRKAENRKIRAEEEKKSYALLLSKLDDELAILVINKKTTYQVWRTLEEHQESKSQAAIAALKKQLSDLVFDDHKSVTSHLAVVQKIRQELLSAGVVLTDEDVITHVFKSMKNSTQYSTCFETLNHLKMLAGDTVKITYDKLTEMLLEKERELKNFEREGLSSSEKAMMTKPQSKSDKDSLNTKETGNRAHRDDRTPSSQSGGHRDPRTCHNCKKPGHIAKNCRSQGGELQEVVLTEVTPTPAAEIAEMIEVIAVKIVAVI
ncbi:hypothetical protein HK101_011081 [Irineochytrium annulatum]|nr:hypothetical protein HK101_011081 [Irineochytrium annulatum]